MLAAWREQDLVKRTDLMLSYARAWGADYLVLDFPLPVWLRDELASARVEIAYWNRSYTLLDLRQAVTAESVPSVR